jgi:hypothetical protein
MDKPNTNTKNIPEKTSQSQPSTQKPESTWNKAVDTVKDEINKYHIVEKVKENIPKDLQNNELINSVKNDENVKGILSFFSSAANKNTVKLNLFGRNFNVTYEDRRNLVLLMSTGVLFYHFKPIRKFFKSYLILSLLICRENFDLSNYKF